MSFTLPRAVLPMFLGIALAAVSWPLSAANVPPGYTDVQIASLDQPTDLAFTPDGRLLIVERAGTVHVYKDGALLATPALTLAPSVLCPYPVPVGYGLQGVAVDPEFAANRHVYLSYMRRRSAGCVHRISRFTFAAGDTIDPGSELVLVDNVPTYHGPDFFAFFDSEVDLEFGPDGYLYIGLGDGSEPNPEVARSLNRLSGKILRITRDGDIPPGNPFQGPGTARCNTTGVTGSNNKCREIFASGLHNPSLAFGPGAGGAGFLVSDSGGGYQEINLGQAGADYGWTCRQGAHPYPGAPNSCWPLPPGLVDPLFEYSNFIGECGNIIGGAFVPDGLWPGFDGIYLFVDRGCGYFYRLEESSGTWSRTAFAWAAFGIQSLTFGPRGNTQALYYLVHEAEASGGSKLRRIARDLPNTQAPSAAIASPGAAVEFRVGQTITLTGSATDVEDGPLPPSALAWAVRLNHNGGHTHPVFSGTGNNLTFTAPAPEDLDATEGSFLEIDLTATDSGGLTHTVHRTLQPHRVAVTLATDPEGLGLTVNGTPVTGPHTLTSWEGWGLDIHAPNQQDGADLWIFTSWSDGGAQAHKLVTPASPATVTAVFEESASTGPLDFHTVSPCRLVDTRQGQEPDLAAGTTRTFAAAGVCGVPPTARAIAVNVTVVGAPASGHLRFWPDGTAMPATSVINFTAGQDRANNAVMSLGASGGFSARGFFPSGSVRLIVDVAGWYE